MTSLIPDIFGELRAELEAAHEADKPRRAAIIRRRKYRAVNRTKLAARRLMRRARKRAEGPVDVAIKTVTPLGDKYQSGTPFYDWTPTQVKI